MKKPVLQSNEMFPHVEAWMSGTLSQREYADQHNFFPYIFSYWVKRYRQFNSAEDKKGFLPVSIPLNQFAVPATIEIIGTNGFRLLVHGNQTDPSFIKKLLQ
ncbi:hypothetical protein [Pedobacter sp. Leaf170]|uniref:IS66 family insertion sequence element accessory protein TnpA n=1 Tax=Pedobacter sp. Leaf170 TaxID=2876558 RepID=UPI001E2C2A45|nr:hypothetical protein [Pedobacter sp. Leaf170]